MLTKRYRTLILIVFAMSATFGTGVSVNADQPPDHHGHMTVEDVWATPAGAGSRSILRLRIINEGHDHVHLLGVETPVAKEARIIGRIGNDETRTIDSIGVGGDSNLDMTTSHLWVELGPLTREVQAGESVPIELVFVRGRVRVNAHVHNADG